MFVLPEAKVQVGIPVAGSGVSSAMAVSQGAT
jgi:hypothetical protein